MVGKRLGFIIALIFFFVWTEAKAQHLIGSPHFLEAKNKAAAEDKNLLVHFTASWSNPCSKMFSTTYRDEEVLQILREDFIFTLVDIDDFDGYVLGQHYNINNLPTLVLFDSKGRVLKKNRGALNTEDMMAFMANDHWSVAEKEEVASTGEKDRSEPGLMERINDTPVAETEKESTQSAKKQSQTQEAAPKPSEFYSIQLGAFSEMKNAEQMLQQKSTQAVSSLHLITEGQRYLLLDGEFPTREEAENHLEKLKSAGENGFIKKIKRGDS